MHIGTLVDVIKRISNQIAYYESEEYSEKQPWLDESFIDQRAGMVHSLEELRAHLQSAVERKIADIDYQTGE